MTNAQALERGREAFQRKAWAESYRLLQAADREAALEPEDLERLATAGYLMGRDDESEAFRARAHQTFLDRGDPEGAARSACLAGVWTASSAAPWRRLRAGSPEPNASSTKRSSTASCADIS